MPLPNGVVVYSGNLVFLQFAAANGTVNFVGLGQTATVSQDAGLQAASGIGDNRVKQWVPGMATVTVEVQDMALNSQSYEALGAAPTSSLLDLLTMVPFDIQILDQSVAADGTYSVTPIKQIQSCIYASGSTNINKHAPVTVNATFNGLDVSGDMVFQPAPLAQFQGP